MSLSIALAFVGRPVRLIVDRPIGSAHPVHGFTYELNYGYVPHTLVPDGEELDAYVLRISEPLADFEGVCVAVVHRLGDDDDKLVVIPRGSLVPSDEEISAAVAFQERPGGYEVRRS